MGHTHTFHSPRARHQSSHSVPHRPHAPISTSHGHCFLAPGRPSRSSPLPHNCARDTALPPPALQSCRIYTSVCRPGVTAQTHARWMSRAGRRLPRRIVVPLALPSHLNPHLDTSSPFVARCSCTCTFANLIFQTLSSPFLPPCHHPQPSTHQHVTTSWPRECKTLTESRRREEKVAILVSHPLELLVAHHRMCCGRRCLCFCDVIRATSRCGEDHAHRRAWPLLMLAQAVERTEKSDGNDCDDDSGKHHWMACTLRRQRGHCWGRLGHLMRCRCHWRWRWGGWIMLLRGQIRWRQRVRQDRGWRRRRGGGRWR